MNEETMTREIERLQDLIATVQPGSDAYRNYVDDLEHITDIRNKILKNDSEIEESKSTLRAQEKRNREDCRLKEEELRIKKKDARNKVLLGVLGIVGTIGQTALVAHWEDLKPLVGKAWGYVKKIPDRF